MSKKFSILSFFCIVFFFGQVGISQTQDSIKTAFRKGRWFTGLAGSISSTTTELQSSNLRTTSNNYGINIESGKFIKDRFLVGGLFRANKINTNASFDVSAETLYVGPFATYYFMNEKIGSLFTKFSFGYVRYKDETNFLLEDVNTIEFSEGDGIGSILALGYSYTINDYVAFDLAFNLNLFWVSIDTETLPDEINETSRFSSSDVSLSFGFNIILDDFFF